ncbi:MAG: mechanosensitive ion channel family protein [Bryobacteraceae bacterium]|nr:mechanosensitive ion channel family protein [Bryobacteraceae bacterium]
MQIRVPDAAFFYPFLERGVRAVAILVAAWVITLLFRRLLRRLNGYAERMLQKHDGGPRIEMEKRARTLTDIVGRAASIAVWVTAILMALREGLGFEAMPLLASAGVAGIAIGFGAQSVVKDVITGLFLLMEDRIRLNDVVVINGTGGLVEEINLRTTVIRSLDGTVHIFPNGQIQTLANMTYQYSYYVFDIPVAYSQDTDKVAEIAREVAEGMRAEQVWGAKILEPLEVLGVDKFADSAVILKARIKTLPIQQWEVGREMNRRLKKRFDELGIEIPFPQRTLWMREAPAGREERMDEIRSVVRELLREAKGA